MEQALRFLKEYFHAGGIGLEKDYLNESEELKSLKNAMFPFHNEANWNITVQKTENVTHPYSKLSTPKLRYYESRYSEIRDIVNKCQLPQFFIPYTVTI